MLLMSMLQGTSDGRRFQKSCVSLVSLFTWESLGNRLEVIILSEGLFLEAEFARLLLLSEDFLVDCEKVLLNDGSFDFPTAALYVSIKNDAYGLPGDGYQLAAAYQSLCSNIALPFTPELSQDLLRLQVEQLCQRLGDLGDHDRGSPSAASASAASASQSLSRQGSRIVQLMESVEEEMENEMENQPQEEEELPREKEEEEEKEEEDEKEVDILVERSF